MNDHGGFRIEVLLSFQRALWDQVTPSLRGICARISYPSIEARFLYESVDMLEREITAEVETEVYSDFVPPVTAEFRAVAVPNGQPRELEDGEEWIYVRRETSRYTVS